MVAMKYLKRVKLLWRPSVLLFLFVLGAFSQSSTGKDVQRKIIHVEKSVYRDLYVTELERRQCIAFQISILESCRYLDEPNRIYFEYIRLIVAALPWALPPQNILIVGLGGGTIPMLLGEVYPDAMIEVVELDAAMLKVAKSYFGFTTSERMQVTISDGRVAIKRALRKGKTYDLVILDAFDESYIPPHMLTKEFLGEIKKILKPKGVVVSHTFSGSDLYDYESVTYEHVFGAFWSLAPQGSGNRIIVAGQNISASETERWGRVDTISHLAKKYNVDVSGFQSMFNQEADWEDVRILEDGFSPTALLSQKKESIIHREKSLYREIFVRESKFLRCLSLSLEDRQSCVYLNNDDRVFFDYIKMMFAFALLVNDPERFLVIGLGGGTIPKLVQRLYPNAKLTIVELDPAMLNVAQDYFGFKVNQNTDVVIKDGRVFSKTALREGVEAFDVILLDAFDINEIPPHMTTQEYLSELRQLLKPEGQLVAHTSLDSGLFNAESATYASVFPFIKQLSTRKSGSRIIFARESVFPKRRELDQQAQKLVREFARFYIAIEDYPAELVPLSPWPDATRILTDDYSPVNVLHHQ